MASQIPHVGGLLFLVVLFGLASVHKLRDFRRFVGVVSAYFKGARWTEGLPRRLLAVCVVAWELCVTIVASIALFLPSAVVIAALLAAGVLLMYALAMAVNLARGNRMLDCGCSWGEGRTPVSYLLVARNMVLAGMASLLLIPLPPAGMGVFDVVNAIAMALLAYLLYSVADQLIVNQGSSQEVSR